MPCDPAYVACQVSRLVDALSGWDWNTFVSTLIATLFGGVISLVGVWWGLRWQRRNQYNAAVDEAVVRFLHEVADYAAAGNRYLDQQGMIKDYERLGLSYFTRTGEDPIEEPKDFSMSIVLEIAQMRARGVDQDLMSEAIRAYDQARENLSIRDRMRALSLIGAALSRWRSGIWPLHEARASLGRAAAFAEHIDVVVED